MGEVLGMDWRVYLVFPQHIPADVDLQGWTKSYCHLGKCMVRVRLQSVCHHPFHGHRWREQLAVVLAFENEARERGVQREGRYLQTIRGLRQADGSIQEQRADVARHSRIVQEAPATRLLQVAIPH